MTKPTRTQRRDRYDDTTRLSLLEDDVDILETLFSEVRDGQKRIQTVLWSFVSALLVAVVLLALNLAVGGVPVPGS